MDIDTNTTTLTNTIVPSRTSNPTSNLTLSYSGQVTSITPHNTSTTLASSSPPSLLLPPLCHPHIHLDKPFLLTSHQHDPSLPDYSDLAPSNGSFAEALSNTSKAKQRYTPADLVLRGSQMIAESIQYGVASMRAFVEVDSTTQMKCVEAGVELKRNYVAHCHVQLCVFAQDPIFTNSDDVPGEKNRELVLQALRQYRGEVEVLGTTPYVEADEGKQRENIAWAVETAMEFGLHLDFHLDYNLDKGSTPMLWEVLRVLREKGWTRGKSERKVMIGHCSRMTLFGGQEMERLAKEVREGDLPVAFVGLPTSDLFMMGRPGEEDAGMTRPRGTMQLVTMKQEYGLDCCVGINNVGNAFTPWGSLDPLRLASLGVGVYQAGTKDDAEILFGMVSGDAERACGIPRHRSAAEEVKEGSKGPWLVVRNEDKIAVDGMDDVETVPARARVSIADCVWDPPESGLRKVVGRLQ